MRSMEESDNWNHQSVFHAPGRYGCAEQSGSSEILAYQYDLVCNGVLSSGAVRNHDPEIMIKAFELVGWAKWKPM